MVVRDILAWRWAYTICVLRTNNNWSTIHSRTVLELQKCGGATWLASGKDTLDCLQHAPQQEIQFICTVRMLIPPELFRVLSDCLIARLRD